MNSNIDKNNNYFNFYLNNDFKNILFFYQLCTKVKHKKKK